MPTNRKLNQWTSSRPTPDLVPQYRGVWASAKYEASDIVTYNGVLYIAKQNTTALDRPGSSTKWEPFITAQNAAPTPGGTGAQLVRFDSVANLSAVGLSDGATVQVTAYTAGTGLGGGTFQWVATSTAEPDGGGVFVSKGLTAAEPGRFIRISHVLGTYRPEDFGALGDGTHDDYPAWMRLTAAVNRRKSGTVLGRGPDAIYYFGQYVDSRRSSTAEGPVDPWADTPTFRGFNSLIVDMQGATIKQYVGGHRPQGNYAYTDWDQYKKYDSPVEPLSGFTFAYGKKLILQNARVDGSMSTWTRWKEEATVFAPWDGRPQNGGDLTEGYSQGVQLWGVEEYLLNNVEAYDHQTDGFFIGHSEVYGPDGPPQRVTNETRTLCKYGTMLNCKARKNRRQGMSVIAAQYLTVINCDFSDTGGVIGVDANGLVLDAYGGHTPGAGVDIEPSTYPEHPNTAWRVPELTGDISFINCRMVNNFGGPFIALYSAKIYGNITITGSLLDSQHTKFYDAVLGAACGVTLENNTIYLPPAGFLWQDHNSVRKSENLGCTVRNNRIFLKKELGFTNTTRPIPLNFINNKVFFPAVNPSGDNLPIFFIDRANGQRGIGGFMKTVRYEGNHHYIPYTFVAPGSQYGDLVAMFEGVGSVKDNVWELTGVRPTLDPNFKWQIAYHTDMGNGAKRYDTKPMNERYISAAGATDGSDFMVSTKLGWRVTTSYTFPPESNVKSFIPFGSPGEAPKGVNTISIGSVPHQIVAKDVSAAWDVNMPAGANAQLRFYVDGVQKATADFAVGSQVVATKTGFPFTIWPGASLRIDLNFTGTATNWNLAGHLLTEEG